MLSKEAIKKSIEALAEKHSNAIAIFGGAYFIDQDLETIVRYLPNIIRGAEFFKWHGGLADACRVFCHCLFVDPALVECYIGMKFEKLTEEN